jgi:Transglutaminase-like superfamily
MRHRKANHRRKSGRWADEITKGNSDRRDQARLIFDWVSKNVRYMAIVLGSGGYVPHDAASVLANKYGDCKDHATLMRALLAAKGIDADYVLISVVASYKTFDTPTPDWFNHLILYLPELGLYADPTASYVSFGILPYIEADKPVLRTGKNGVTYARTPPMSAEANLLSVKADVTVRADGTATGSATTIASGESAFYLRWAMAQAALKGGATYVKEQLGRQNWRGTGDIEVREATDHTEPYVAKATFDLTNKFFGEGSSVNAIPVGPDLVFPVYSHLLSFIRENRTQDFQCIAGTYEQSIDLHLPEGRALAKSPSNVSATAPLASYSSTYVLDGQRLHVERQFVSKVPGQVCTAQMAKEMASVVEAAGRDFEFFSNLPIRLRSRPAV